MTTSAYVLWSGDACAPNPCQNGGSCVFDEPSGSFRCYCPSGYTGRTCDIGKLIWTRFNDNLHVSMTMHACVYQYHHRQCDHICSFKCMLTESLSKWWTLSSDCSGIFRMLMSYRFWRHLLWNSWVMHSCQQCVTYRTLLNSCDIFLASDACRPNPCQNNGFCIANGFSFTCSCTNGLSGQRCELRTWLFFANVERSVSLILNETKHSFWFDTNRRCLCTESMSKWRPMQFRRNRRIHMSLRSIVYWATMWRSWVSLAVEHQSKLVLSRHRPMYQSAMSQRRHVSTNEWKLVSMSMLIWLFRRRLCNTWFHYIVKRYRHDILCMYLGEPCAQNPCLNGGQCQADAYGGFACRCPSGFIGQRCEDRQ
jgi:hypothetical protein